MSTYELWKCIIDIVGDPSDWPQSIRRLFWTQWLTSHQRCMVASFSFVNGLPQPLLMNWCSALNLLKNKASEDHLNWLFFVFRRGNAYNLYFAWNVKTGRYEYVSGKPRPRRRSLRPNNIYEAKSTNVQQASLVQGCILHNKVFQTLSKKM